MRLQTKASSSPSLRAAPAVGASPIHFLSRFSQLMQPRDEQDAVWFGQGEARRIMASGERPHVLGGDACTEEAHFRFEALAEAVRAGGFSVGDPLAAAFAVERVRLPSIRPR